MTQTVQGAALARLARPRVTLRWLGEMLGRNAIVVAVAVIVICLALSSDVFFTKTNLLNLLEQNATIGIITCGATLVIIAGGFDLSVGAVFAIGGVVAAKVAIATGIPPIAFAAGVAAGAGLGLVNGLVVSVGGVNPFIATLASSFAFRGVALILTGGLLVTVESDGFVGLGNDGLLGVKYTIIVFAITFIVLWTLLARTTFGRHVYAAGANPEAARLAGVAVGRVRAITFVISGACAGLAGILVASRVSTGQADSGAGLELSSIAAAVIGGTSIAGGEGAMWRSMFGVLLIALIGNGFNLLNVNPVYQQIVLGVIIALAVGVDTWSKRRR